MIKLEGMDIESHPTIKYIFPYASDLVCFCIMKKKVVLSNETSLLPIPRFNFAPD